MLDIRVPPRYSLRTLQGGSKGRARSPLIAPYHHAQMVFHPRSLVVGVGCWGWPGRGLGLFHRGGWGQGVARGVRLTKGIAAVRQERRYPTKTSVWRCDDGRSPCADGNVSPTQQLAPRPHPPASTTQHGNDTDAVHMLDIPEKRGGGHYSLRYGIEVCPTARGAWGTT